MTAIMGQLAASVLGWVDDAKRQYLELPSVFCLHVVPKRITDPKQTVQLWTVFNKHLAIIRRGPINIEFVRNLEQALLLIVSAAIPGLQRKELTLRIKSVERAVVTARSLVVYNSFLEARSFIKALGHVLRGSVPTIIQICFAEYIVFRTTVFDLTTMDAPSTGQSAPPDDPAAVDLSSAMFRELDGTDDLAYMDATDSDESAQDDDDDEGSSSTDEGEET